MTDKPKHVLTIHPTCTTCGHRLTDHGDRAIGICAHGHYPMSCDCTGYTDEVEGHPV